jgi:hypothetical protein
MFQLEHKDYLSFSISLQWLFGEKKYYCLGQRRKRDSWRIVEVVLSTTSGLVLKYVTLLTF